MEPTQVVSETLQTAQKIITWNYPLLTQATLRAVQTSQPEILVYISTPSTKHLALQPTRLIALLICPYLDSGFERVFKRGNWDETVSFLVNLKIIIPV